MKRSGRASVQPRDANSAFLKWGVPQLSSILIRFFFINHPAIGVPPFIETLKNTLTYNMFARNMWNEGRQDRPSMSKYDQNMIKHAQNSLSAHIVANSCKFSNPGVTMVPLWCQEKLRKG